VAPRLDDRTDATLGRNPVGASGAWAAAHEDDLAVKDGTAAAEMPPGSAVLVEFL
jgi:hypothetical protein